MTDAATVRHAFELMLERITAAEDELGRLDAAAGDGDHGAGMVRGLRAAVDALADQPGDASVGALLIDAGSAFADEAGGASGALFGALFTTVGITLGDSQPSAVQVASALAAALAAVSAMGKAQPGDKTLIDTLHPFVQALQAGVASGLPLGQAWNAALPAAEAGAESTAQMVARRGRSARLGERSLGVRDPGAVSMLLMLQAAGETPGS